MQKNKKDIRNKWRKKAEMWCGNCVSIWTPRPSTQSEEVMVMTEGVTVLFFPSAQALHCQKKGCTLLPGQQSRELAHCPGSAAPNRSPMGS